MIALCSYALETLPFPFPSPTNQCWFSSVYYGHNTLRYIFVCDICSSANIGRWGEGRGENEAMYLARILALSCETAIFYIVPK